MDVFNLQAAISLNPSEFNAGLDNAAKKFKAFSDNIENISKNIKKAYDGVGNVLEPLVNGFQDVENIGKKAGDAITSGLRGFAAISTAIAGFGTAAVRSGMTFDATMSNVSAISGATGDDFQVLRDKALEMGAKTKFSASEAAEAMTYMGMAGWKAGDMISGISGIMNLAAASGEDLATTSDIVTDALTAFGLKASDSGRFADVLAAAATNANTNVGMMGDTFKYIAPIAGQLGYTAEDTAIAIGLMANSGIKATQAGTALRSIITRLSTNAGATKTQMGALEILTKKLGVEFYNTDGTARSLNDVLAESRAAWQGLNSEESISYAKLVAGQEAMSGWLSLMGAAPEDVDKLTTAIYECNGAAETMAATMVDNLQGDLTLLGSAFESLQIAISDSLTPTLRSFAQFGQTAMANLLEGFQGSGVSGFMSTLSGVVTQGVTMLAGEAPKFVSVSMQFVEALANGLLAAKNTLVISANESFRAILGGFDNWLTQNSNSLYDLGMGIINSIFNAFTRAGEVISEHIGKFVPLMANAFLSYHEGFFSVGADILGSIGQGIVNNRDSIDELASSAIGGMVKSLRDNAGKIVDGALALLEALASAITENLPLILATGAEIIGKLVEGIGAASPAVQAIIGATVIPHILKIVETVGAIGSAVGGVVKLVSDGIGTIMGIGSKLMAGVQALWGLIMAHPVVAVVAAIVAAVTLLWTHCEGFRDAVGAIWDAIVGFFQTAADLIKAAFDGVVDFFKGVWDGIQAIFAGVAEFFGGLFEAAAGLVRSAWDAIVSFFHSVWDGIQGVFSVVADVLGGFFSAAAEAVQSAWEAVSEFFAGVWEAIQDVFSVVAEVLGGFFRAAWDAIHSIWTEAAEFFGGIADGIRSAFEAVTQFLGDAFSAAWEAVSGAWGAATEFFSGIWETISGLFGGAAEWFGGIFSAAWTAVTSAWDGVGDFFSGLWESVKNVFGDAWDAFSNIGKNIVDGIRNGISNAWKNLTSWVSGLFKDLVNSVKSMLGIHSPSTVFAGIGGNMALGLGEGWNAEYSAIKAKIENGMNFSGGVATMSLATNGTNYGGSAYRQIGQNEPDPGIGGTGNMTVIINNPTQRDAVTEAREWRKTMQRLAVGC